MQLIKKMIILNGLTNSANAVVKVEKNNNDVKALVNFYSLFKDNMYLGVKTKKNALKIYPIKSNNSAISLESDLSFEDIIECTVVDMSNMTPLYYGATNAQRPVYANLLDGFQNYKIVKSNENEKKNEDNKLADKSENKFENKEKKEIKTETKADNKIENLAENKAESKQNEKNDTNFDDKKIDLKVNEKTIKVNAVPISQEAKPVQGIEIIEEEEAEEQQELQNQPPLAQRERRSSDDPISNKIENQEKKQLEKKVENKIDNKIYNKVEKVENSPQKVDSQSQKTDTLSQKQKTKAVDDMPFDNRPITPIELNVEDVAEKAQNAKSNEKKADNEKVYCPEGCNIANKLGEQNKPEENKNFYKSIENKLFELLKNNPKEEVLMSLIQGSKWAKVVIDKDNFYVVGILTEDNKPSYVCYGVEGNKNISPQDCKDYQWIPVTPDESKGYWIIFQDAVTGKVIIDN